VVLLRTAARCFGPVHAVTYRWKTVCYSEPLQNLPLHFVVYVWKG
jgi:hypothetical protein